MVLTSVILSGAKNLGIYFQANTGILRSAQDDDVGEVFLHGASR
ncbi:MAG TPA: hypothetical protein VNM47_06725 [Terriglobia bacterium]|nr:hypothetical protein [Terriglobia bacterium]